MNLAVEIFEIVAPMADHGMREGSERLLGDFNRAGNKKLVVREHEENVQHSTPKVFASKPPNAQRSTQKRELPKEAGVIYFPNEILSLRDWRSLICRHDIFCLRRITELFRFREQ